MIIVGITIEEGIVLDRFNIQTDIISVIIIKDITIVTEMVTEMAIEMVIDTINTIRKAVDQKEEVMYVMVETEEVEYRDKREKHKEEQTIVKGEDVKFSPFCLLCNKF